MTWRERLTDERARQILNAIVDAGNDAFFASQRADDSDEDTSKKAKAAEVATLRAEVAALTALEGAEPPPQYGTDVLCPDCAVVFCPHGERLHFDKDGCPACYEPDGPTELRIAERIARQAHSEQKDTVTGAPYITHVERVVAAVEGDKAKAVAWLHDVLEDSDITTDELRSEGISNGVIAAVELLTRTPPYEYASYIDRIKSTGDPLAVAVKLADLRDHLHPNCPERLRPRYERALAVLAPAAAREGAEEPTGPHFDTMSPSQAKAIQQVICENLKNILQCGCRHPPPLNIRCCVSLSVQSWHRGRSRSQPNGHH
jgi:hypothetical protein